MEPQLLKEVADLKQKSDQISDEEFGSYFNHLFETISDEYLKDFTIQKLEQNSFDMAKIDQSSLYDEIEKVRQDFKQMPDEQKGRIFKNYIRSLSKEDLEELIEFDREYRQLNERKTIRVDLFDDKQQLKDTVFIKNMSIDSLLQQILSY